jgi:hypothetical protein
MPKREQKAIHRALVFPCGDVGTVERSTEERVERGRAEETGDRTNKSRGEGEERVGTFFLLRWIQARMGRCRSPPSRVALVAATANVTHVGSSPPSLWGFLGQCQPGQRSLDGRVPFTRKAMEGEGGQGCGSKETEEERKRGP